MINEVTVIINRLFLSVLSQIVVLSSTECCNNWLLSHGN